MASWEAFAVSPSLANCPMTSPSNERPALPGRRPPRTPPPHPGSSSPSSSSSFWCTRARESRMASRSTLAAAVVFSSSASASKDFVSWSSNRSPCLSTGFRSTAGFASTLATALRTGFKSTGGCSARASRIAQRVWPTSSRTLVKTTSSLTRCTSSTTCLKRKSSGVPSLSPFTVRAKSVRKAATPCCTSEVTVAFISSLASLKSWRS
mmetsp:Transcript_4336/g.9352  ORF Transcript_4336/g.9352 Transcript_4336/m.9352 type:complete len:208 (-) Transcript_4336:460-1083(-)